MTLCERRDEVLRNKCDRGSVTASGSQQEFWEIHLTWPRPDRSKIIYVKLVTWKVRVLNFIILTYFIHVPPNALIANSTLSVFYFSDEDESNDPAIVFYYSCSPSCLFTFSILHLCFDPSLFDTVSVLLFISSKCVWVNLPDLSVALKTVSVGTLFSSTIHWPLFIFRTPIIFNCHSVTSFSIAQLGAGTSFYFSFSASLQALAKCVTSLFLCIQIGPRNKTHMCSGGRVGSLLNGPLLISTPLIWRLMGLLHWALRWVTWPRKDPLQPSTLPPVREIDRTGNGKKGMVLFFVICMILKLQESNSLWLQRFNHYCLFFRAWN